jgi:hypothetical protein
VRYVELVVVRKGRRVKVRVPLEGHTAAVASQKLGYGVGAAGAAAKMLTWDLVKGAFASLGQTSFGTGVVVGYEETYDKVARLQTAHQLRGAARSLGADVDPVELAERVQELVPQRYPVVGTLRETVSREEAMFAAAMA